MKDPTGAHTGQKLVHISEVTPFIEDEWAVSYPNILATAGGTGHAALDGISLRAVKRRRVVSEGEVQVSIDMLVKSGEREMVASRGHHELNYDYYVGVRNKNTGDTKLVEVDGLYCLRPSVRSGIDFSRFDEADEKDEKDDRKKTYVERRNELLKAFGGKKSLSRVTRWERNRITEEKVSDRMADKINESAKAMRERDAEQGISHDADETTEPMAPPHNNAATDPKDAYPLMGLLSAPELLALDQEAAAMIELSEDPTTLENPGWDTLVWDVMLNILSKEGDAKETKMLRLQAIMHLHYLIVLANAPAKITRAVRNTLIEKMAVDDEVLECLLERYTTADERAWMRSRSKSDSARILGYAILMWLTALGFKNCQRLGELSAAFQVNTSTLVKIAANLGCKVKKPKAKADTNMYSISLRMPLTFPRLKKRFVRTKP
ncbi:DNA-directed RNA polymerase I subunit RPA49 [Gracilariopsis chorda]|uniref:DNA-directed RNA polymerase I subunit RPA49 n=1 Tax=Gracilariopsis chorda TaxID=448386 RepID=A0A2V3IU74_9FLOR|nr:DNA-directed RNA polymerase I subunit RPA49 [Gracilariopsis chorda]|eukprot:PXF44670.1 DNA-directed RNA polymerase I subunit RPA49 [Gracilariopsis chorda]